MMPTDVPHVSTPRAAASAPAAGSPRAAVRWRNAVPLALAAGLGVAAALALCHIAGPALAAPPGWRRLVVALGTGTAVAGFAAARYVALRLARRSAAAVAAPGPDAAAAHAAGGPAPSDGRLVPAYAASVARRSPAVGVNFRRGLVAAGASVVCLVALTVLRAACVQSWDARDWMIGERLASAAAAEEAASGGGASGPAPAANPLEQRPGGGVPDFIDLERGEIYLPLWFRPDQRQYLRDVEIAHSEDGLTYVLNNEPDRLIDWLRGPSGMALRLTTTLFLLLFAATLTALGAAGGFWSQPLGAVLLPARRGAWAEDDDGFEARVSAADWDEAVREPSPPLPRAPAPGPDAPARTPHDVFISHSSKDKLVADAVCHALESAGVRCWVAPRDILPGEKWAASIARALANSRLIVLVFSGNAQRSHQIPRELERAVHYGVPIAPFRIEDVMPVDDMEYYLSSSHWMDAIQPPLDQHLHRLAESVRRLLQIAR